MSKTDESANKIRQDGCSIDSQQCIQYFKTIADLRHKRLYLNIVKIFDVILDKIEYRQSLKGSNLVAGDSEEKRL